MSTKAIVEWLRAEAKAWDDGSNPDSPWRERAEGLRRAGDYIEATFPDAPRETPTESFAWNALVSTLQKGGATHTIAALMVAQYRDSLAPRETGERGEVRELVEAVSMAMPDLCDCDSHAPPEHYGDCKARGVAAALRALSRSGEEPGSGAGEGGER